MAKKAKRAKKTMKATKRTRSKKQTKARATARKRVSRKSAARKSARPRSRPASPRLGSAPPSTPTMEVAVGTCLDLGAAGEIVQAAIPGGPHDIDSSLEDAGLISPNQRTVFRERVVQGVEDRGCSIDGDAVPNTATTTLRQARTAVRDNAGPA